MDQTKDRTPAGRPTDPEDGAAWRAWISECAVDTQERVDRMNTALKAGVRISELIINRDRDGRTGMEADAA